MAGACVVCGAANESSARFCSNCGAQIAAAGPLEQRKTVTVVFSDLVGSTSMAEGLDPESLAAILGTYFGSMRAVLERHGGTVEKYIGDAIMAVFGVPVLHEDDALRAVRAALEMRTALGTLNTDLERRYGVRLQARTGVNTGEVAVGPRSVGGSLALGHPVSLAARLEQAAGPGEILVGPETHQLLGGSVRSEAIAPISVKGATEPIHAWRITGAVERPEPAWRADDLFVGRGSELAALGRAFEVVVRDRVCMLLTLSAPPGYGKSRLAAEWTAGLADRARVLVGRCLPYGESITYAPLIDMVRQLETASDGPSIEVVLAAMPDGAQVLGRVRATIHGASHGSPEETSWSFRRLFEVLAAERPLVIVIEDLHWAEPLLVDLIEYMTAVSTEHPILLLCLARPEFLDSRPGWSARPNATALRLEALTSTETDALLARLDTDVGLDAGVRRRIVESSGGVPLFVEQMVAMGADRGSPTDSLVPPTIRALLAARVDRLGARERTVLDRAAVIGEAFGRSLLIALMPGPDHGDLDARLVSLTKGEFVRADRSAGPEVTYRFNHALIRDAVYDAMPRRLRSELHERFAGILEAAGDSAQEVIGHHLEAAYAERLALGPPDAAGTALGIRAGLALHAAGRRAVAREESRHAVGLLRRSADLVRTDPATLVTVLPDLIDALVALPDLDAADDVRDEAAVAARALGDRTSELRAEMAWARAGYLRDIDSWAARSREIAAQAVDHFGPLEDDVNLAHAWLLAAAATAGSDLAATIETLRRAESYARRADDERAQIMVWDELGGVMLQGRTPYPEVLTFVRDEVAWARERGVAFTEADGMLGEAYGLAAMGDLPGAREVLARVRVVFADLPGVVSQHGESYTLGGSIELEDGNPAAAEQLYRRALLLFDEAGNRRWGRGATVGLAHALLDQSRLDEASAAIAELAAQPSTASIRSDSWLLSAQARLAALRGDHAMSISLARAAVDILSGTDSIHGHARAREILASLLVEGGHDAEARGELERAAALYAEKAYLPGLTRVTDRLATM